MVQNLVWTSSLRHLVSTASLWWCLSLTCLLFTQGYILQISTFSHVNERSIFKSSKKSEADCSLSHATIVCINNICVFMMYYYMFSVWIRKQCTTRMKLLIIKTNLYWWVNWYIELANIGKNFIGSANIGVLRWAATISWLIDWEKMNR